MLSSSPTSIFLFSTQVQLSPSSTSVPLSFASLIKGKKVRDKVIEGIEVREINVENKNKVDDDVEIMKIDVENEDIQNGNIKSRTEEKVKKNFKAKELKKKFKKFVLNDLQANTHNSSVHRLPVKDMVDESDMQNNNLTHSLNLYLLIKIKDKESAIQKVKQWGFQKDQIENWNSVQCV
ncbi:unnamed protein product [Rhizophagus irregularis]|uniref:Uncharacterized protein n=1 Tax=Rhizophagus irregularis TaxID=588596 RepID=A0A915ZUH5_9GLOM|nr:unnamed protein product [Rhizophagus irregularis]CAB5388674.1 unnamed protein product [Rhizophagus irregularis]